MGWATNHIANLQNGETISFRPHGGSMKGKIESGQLCTVSPTLGDLQVGDIVLCKVKGKEFLHLIKDIKNGKYQIGNNCGHINGWIELKSIFGKLIKVED